MSAANEEIVQIMGPSVPANSSGAILFKVKSPTGAAQLQLYPFLPPHKKHYYNIYLRRCSRVVELLDNMTKIQYKDYDTEFIDIKEQFQEFWVSWYNNEILVGHNHSTEPFLHYVTGSLENEMIGYCRFVNECKTEWIYETPPKVFETPLPVKIYGSELRWVTMIGNLLPPDALIGGFEYEPTYIACASHMGSMCPGKYVPSKALAYVPWGGREHIKTEFKILCGYNATWVQTYGNVIPKNAFIGGTSEVRNEPLYIGRAVHSGNLISGKVQVSSSKCHLPYYGKEYGHQDYEILVVPNGDA